MHLSLKKLILLTSKKGRGIRVKDIDFDELDKAVSTVLGQQPPQTEDTAATDTAAPQTTSATTEQSTDEQVVAPQDAVEALNVETASETTVTTPEESVADSVAVPAVENTSVTPAQRRGKFMDVVHPSSDMNPNADAAVTPRGVAGRRTISPINPDVKPEELPAPEEVSEAIDPLSSAVADVETRVIPNAPDPADNGAPEAISIPTEIGVSGPPIETLPPSIEPSLETDAEADITQPTEVAEEAATPPSSDEPQPVDDTDMNDSMPDPLDVAAQNVQQAVDASVENDTASPEEAPQTPFIPGVEVDKRPLGQATDQTQTDGSLPDADMTAATPSPVEPSLSTPVDPAPPEFESTVVQTENTHEAEAVDATVPSGSVMTPPTDETAFATGQPTDNALFDTQTYNQPLSETVAAKKNTPSWVWWVIGLTGCLLVGGGIGAAFFFVGL